MSGPHPNHRWHQIKYRYGVTREAVAEILERQGGGCAICARPLDISSGRSAYIDHDHACHPRNEGCPRCVRGVLCSTCNSALASVEIPGWYEKARAYLAGRKVAAE